MPDSLIEIPVSLTVYLAVEPVDMRKQHDGLSAIVHDQLKMNPLAPNLYVFRNKRSDRIKCLYWDRHGLVLWYKRLEKGKFKWPKNSDQQMCLTSQELKLLLDGVDISKLKRLPSLTFDEAF